MNRLSVRQILVILREEESGIGREELYRRHQITPGTYRKWKKKYFGLTAQEALRVDELEAENRLLRGFLEGREVDERAVENLVMGAGRSR